MFDTHGPEHEPFETPRWLLGFYILIVAIGMFFMSMQEASVGTNTDWRKKPEPTMWEQVHQEAREQRQPVYSEWGG